MTLMTYNVAVDSHTDNDQNMRVHYASTSDILLIYQPKKSYTCRKGETVSEKGEIAVGRHMRPLMMRITSTIQYTTIEYHTNIFREHV